MTIPSSKNLGADVRRAKSALLATGPLSEQGKLRSSLNAVRHGLAAKQLLLPGEDADDYAVRMDALFASLAPKNEAEAQLVALVGDDLWKLARLERIEHGLTLSSVEQLLSQTDEVTKAASTARALTALGNALEAWESQALPAMRTPDFDRRLKQFVAAVGLVGEERADLPAELLSAAESFMFQLLLKQGDTATTASADACLGLLAAGGAIMRWLLDRGDREEAAQENVRKDIAALALPSEVELKKLARYRKLLEEGLQRRLQSLEQMRKLTTSQPATEQETEKAKAYRVQLRLVR